ncbi:ATP-dependent helicase HrpB [Thiomicrorhabdus cannonii]|uniref:ATP-dependent helicase HrpB n=1 Tax=Thiomicrorhabdus cannonii TaxID=2748011 RepID=UPI001FE4C962|nr:ATP-dependent helicase HrpB [Thiomicrorhabdus cannonii]
MMTSLPITPLLPQVLEAVDAHPNVVLQAEPGAGKSTAVPLALLLSDWFNAPQNAGKKIVMLEPRRLAVRSLANYLAKQLNEPVGERVGYQVRNERKVSAKTRLEIVTEGILTRRLQADPELSDTALVIFDEFHERALQADLGLALCLDSQAALRDDLKLLVMSATIDTQAVSTFLDGAPVLSSQGRSFPVETVYASQPLNVTAHFKFDLLPRLTQMIRSAFANTQNDMLVFLPGQREILQTQEALTEWAAANRMVVTPLYGGLKPDEQDRAILPDANGKRKIVLTTNIAETSLTIEGIDCVVDSGLSRKALFDVNSGMTRLETVRISAASAEQRKGRAGRLQAGQCYRLWTETQQGQLQPFDPEEIRIADLSGLCLELALWGVQNPDDLRWLTPPPVAHFEQSRSLLQSLTLLDDKGRLTALGQQAVSFGSEPRLARLLLAAVEQSDEIKVLACDIAALLSERELLRQERVQDVGADLSARLLALQSYRRNRKQGQQEGVMAPVAEQVLMNSRNWQQRLLKAAGTRPVEFSLDFLQQHVGLLLAQAFPDRIALRRAHTDGGERYQLTNGRGALLKEGDVLGREACLVVANIDGQAREGRIFLAAPLEKSQLDGLFAERMTTRAYYRYDEKRREIVGSEQRRLMALVLDEKPLDKPDMAALQACLLDYIKTQKGAVLPWTETQQAGLQRMRWLAGYAPEDARWPDVSEAWLLTNLEIWLAPFMAGVASIKALKNIDLKSALNHLLSYGQLQVLEREAPEFYVAPSGKRVKIRYAEGQNPTVSVPLQELFGELTSPRLAWGKVPLTFELLSPAQRPIQVTADLANFWRTSYFDVAKEMRGRYPKHRWPDKPLEEKAGRSIKPRG